MNESEYQPNESDIRGNHVFLNGEDKKEAYESQMHNDIEDAKLALSTAEELLEKAESDEYADIDSAKQLVEMRKTELDAIIAKYDKNQTSH